MSTPPPELPSERDRLGTFPAFLIVLGVVSVAIAGTLYLSETDGEGAFGDAPNYAPALFLVGVGAYLILLAVILLSGRGKR